MTQHYDTAIVGAGILGLAHAYHLARRGQRVLVFERNRCAMGASVRNFGMIWPIGQPAGSMYALAVHSRNLWVTVLKEAGIWHAECGSLHLAYRQDEAAVLEEFVALTRDHGQYSTLLSAREVQQRAPAVRHEGLICALWSPTEVCVDPREALRLLPPFLHSRYGVHFEFDCAVVGYDAPTVHAGGKTWKADRLIVCSGDDLQTLFPESMQALELTRCKLQMLRSQPYGDTFRIGPMLAAGLTLRHYRAFQNCPSLPVLKQRIATETPEFDCYGIHVMASQHGNGEITIGDSHEYDAAITPFNKEQIDNLILDYLRSFLYVPDLRITSRWHGTYVKHPVLPWVTAHPADNVTIVTGAGGAGMTLSFGLAEKVATQILEETL
ncbi:MAG: TIGR03364 family FAD-dependent oxidoreductase [Chloroherpetonaceae bacterium]|nr:TIGR03364 family FAD-dependent oxidoreductase [Chloroherpetonaceae bacterium]